MQVQSDEHQPVFLGSSCCLHCSCPSPLIPDQHTQGMFATAEFYKSSVLFCDGKSFAFKLNFDFWKSILFMQKDQICWKHIFKSVRKHNASTKYLPKSEYIEFWNVMDVLENIGFYINAKLFFCFIIYCNMWTQIVCCKSIW